jgi:hypothetical protein
MKCAAEPGSKSETALRLLASAAESEPAAAPVAELPREAESLKQLG